MDKSTVKFYVDLFATILYSNMGYYFLESIENQDGWRQIALIGGFGVLVWKLIDIWIVNPIKNKMEEDKAEILKMIEEKNN